MSNADILKLNKDVYTEKAVREAIKAFKNYARIELTSSDQYYVCTFNQCRYNSGLTMDEFGNYLIDLMNTKGFA